MGTRNTHGLLIPDARGVGGALEVAQGYRHYYGARAAPSTHTAATPPAAGPTAQQLSRQRAAKQATSDTTAHDHLVRLQHLYQRVAGHAAAAGQQQQQQAQRQQRSPQQRPGGGRPGSMTAGLCPWLPHTHAWRAKNRQKRPCTAPERPEGRTSSGSRQACQAGWQQLKAAAHPTLRPEVQPIQLPPSRYYFPGPSLLPSVQHRLFRAGLMGDILRRQLFRAADIRALCAQAVAAAPPEQRSLLREVACEVLLELDIQPGLELQLAA